MTIFNRRDAQDGQTAGGSNSGVYNTGTMGDVQNLAHSAGSVAHHVTVSGGADAKAAEWARILGELETTLARGGAGITDPEGCRVLLRLIRDQRITDDGERRATGSMLGQISRLCADVEPVTSLVASALALLGLATG
ncbi:hypothetical protein OG223_27705 [Streptomyces sp. NBC_01478]|uniref:hypothetical protein n=1 Tax=Streptomyces sp. NBC_01478 TaxID=2903882 RepID=UPI002E2F200D|nr:hypothetical protein [Streptomyces sp. NBC_01478]